MAIARYEKIQSHYYNHIWVVGDIHGCYTLLNHRLRELAFNKETDLLISVGDNIDRGTENLDVLRLLDEPWFISVIGNHEAMALEAFETQDGNRWLASGGDWFFSLTEQDRQEAITFLLRFQKIPHILEIESNDKKYVIAHADYPGQTYHSNKVVDANAILWPIDRIMRSLEGRTNPISGADFFIFGHMTVSNVQTYANQIYIDTGSATTGKLSFFRIR
ncbi:protein-serine/threonine phosphatase [Klebsiella spallanzanii]|uniref:Serine/threonine-protein phosphatase 2 n=1 Tax=Klebsiella spallanzanii TaxID=2587528 RepID=A0A564LVY1_9ENTR|nr:protein-serine/threonine phosphatase [Klebsiella spallanzanii]MDM4206038.1 protein-serine/threonine phosphatase [Klebsiella spallanzanii]VUS85624.1 Serine/threonine-protein phosphatase 2 [Klebsiella spallanzanii]